MDSGGIGIIFPWCLFLIFYGFGMGDHRTGFCGMITLASFILMMLLPFTLIRVLFCGVFFTSLFYPFVKT